MQFTNWKKIFVKLTARKRLTSRREKNSFKPNVFKWSKELSRRLTLNQRKYRNIKQAYRKMQSITGEMQIKTTRSISCPSAWQKCMKLDDFQIGNGRGTPGQELWP